MLAIFFQLEFLRSVSKFRKRKAKSLSCVPVVTNREIRYFHVVVVQRLQRNVQESACDARTKLLFCQSKPIVFLPLYMTSPSSLLKLPMFPLKHKKL